MDTGTSYLPGAGLHIGKIDLHDKVPCRYAVDDALFAQHIYPQRGFIHRGGDAVRHIHQLEVFQAELAEARSSAAKETVTISVSSISVKPSGSCTVKSICEPVKRFICLKSIYPSTRLL